MPTYTISYKPSAAKAFRRIHPRDRERIKRAIENLAADPRPPGYRRLVGGEGEIRIRVGHFRIVYEINDDKLIVLVLRIGHRRDVYYR